MTHSQALRELCKEMAFAAKRIRASFGLQKALDYLVGEKLLFFLRLAREDTVAARQLPKLAAEIRQIFTPSELHQYLDQLQRKRVILRQETDTNRRAMFPRFTRGQLEDLLLPA
jgi:hypothetical protein